MTRTLPRARQLGSQRTDSPPGLDYLLRHEVSVASESMHGIQNPSEVRVDAQPRREREQLCLREALLIHGKPSDSGRTARLLAHSAMAIPAVGRGRVDLVSQCAAEAAAFPEILHRLWPTSRRRVPFWTAFSIRVTLAGANTATRCQ